MGTFFSLLFGEPSAGAATTSASLDPMQVELEEASALLQLELQMFDTQTTEANFKMQEHLAKNEHQAARIHFDKCRGLQPQTEAVQSALRVVNDQLRAVYHNKLNRTTMDLMRRSAAALNKKGLNIDAASDAVDNLADATEMAQHVASTLADESVTNRTVADNEWEQILLSNTTPAAPVATIAILPTVPEVPLRQSSPARINAVPM